MVRRDALTIVLHLDDDALRCLAHFRRQVTPVKLFRIGCQTTNRQIATCRHGLFRIADEIAQEATDLIRIHGNGRQALLNLDAIVNSRSS